MFDFDALILRDGTGACKWDRRTETEKAENIVPMSVADMEFRVAPCIREAVVAAAEKGIYGYTDPDERYFRAVIGWMERRHHWAVTRNEIVPVYGVVPALSIAVRAFSAPGEGVIIQTPGYYPFREMIEKNGRRIVENPLMLVGDTYEMDFAGLERVAARPDVHLFLMCSPHNPVGRVWTRAELAQVAEIMRRNHCVWVSDEIHFDLTLPGCHTVAQQLDENAIVMTAPSKSFNLPGLQLANVMIRNDALRRKFSERLAADGYSNISHFGYAATIAAYEAGDEWLDAVNGYIRENYEAMRKYLQEKLPALHLIKLEGTYLAWVDCRALGLSPCELEQITRGEAHLVLDEGPIFGSEGAGFERFNIAVPRAVLRAALERFSAALAAHGLI